MLYDWTENGRSITDYETDTLVAKRRQPNHTGWKEKGKTKKKRESEDGPSEEQDEQKRKKENEKIGKETQKQEEMQASIQSAHGCTQHSKDSSSQV